MSGGRYDYHQYRIQDIYESIENAIENNNKEDEWGYTADYSEETIKEFKKGVEILKKAYIYAHRIDWLLSGDDGEESFHRRLKEDLKEI